MKHCLNCKTQFDTEDELCSNCGVKPYEMPQDKAIKLKT